MKHETLKHVYSVFQKSDALIQACKIKNAKAAECLLMMGISSYVQDEEGMTALMHAVKDPKLSVVIEKYKTYIRCLNMEDKNGNNVLFHCIGQSKDILQKLWNADINHTNHDGETVFLYCCKNKLFGEIKKFLDTFQKIDLNIPDKDGKTAIIYINEKGESVLSLLIKRMYGSNNHPKYNTEYVEVIINLIQADIDFNTVVDEDGNTAVMAFLIAGDFETFYFVTKYSHNIDYLKRNKNGENVSSLFLKLGVHAIYEEEKVNVNQENALIIAAKMNRNKMIALLLKMCINVNQQDDMGNTALHYAVQNRNIPMIYDLVKICDKNLNNANMINALHDTLSDSEFRKEIEALKEIHALIRNQRIDEYSYMRVSKTYIKLTNDDLHDLKEAYNIKIKLLKSQIDKLEKKIYNYQSYYSLSESELNSLYNGINILSLMNYNNNH
ncbi:hypothetical protein PIROE2DRAFT_4840 [Piromyces sp. E2]|nr:hypothetical protein PIROE2DRAFT_4840 [Piromyces sp. E2]|eukprot:OUM67670.1 hypothetical protein PIROE2DRAFT_4840 [Piromyces sp. E2]